VRAFADMNISTQSRLKATISIKMNSVGKVHRSTLLVSKDHQAITEIHMLANRRFGSRYHRRRRNEALGAMIRKMRSVLKWKCSQTSDLRSYTST
jgi:hypothetical protein